ncbi:hypothetical protein ED733_004630 [Metarhizium rileyi]|uniref:G-protein coupled receptors family 2 profile 2 domain-containing protein n=1 Tax=Metarhizium rileyi (strain RCEF 4871) TaxID=1649241 RepID=A0A5C6GCF1_METRR|nr:hypothetical protein ED733_004630 [Metarhizium rileyi]
MLTNIGTLMSRAYLGSTSSFGCQFQAFLIQVFMPADAFWTLAMAINVYLTFYLKFDAERLRRMEIPYLIGCYGIPFVPAFVLLFIKTPEGARVYGNATLWCWISYDWDVLRIATFYGPVWVVILATFFIYIRAGRTILEKHKQLREFHSSDPDPLSVNGDAIPTIKTTEITVTSEVAGEKGIQLGSMNRQDSNTGPSARGPNGAYTVHISADTYNSTQTNEDDAFPMQGTTPEYPSAVQIAPRRAANIARRRNHELNNAAWSYTKCSILFFTAILITWIPSTANRVYSLVNEKELCIPLEFMSAFVLPLQGFWNAVIYAVTSWSACRELFEDLTSRKKSVPSELSGGRHGRDTNEYGNSHRPNMFRSPPGSSRTFASDSTSELAKAQAYTADGGQHS